MKPHVIVVDDYDGKRDLVTTFVEREISDVSIEEFDDGEPAIEWVRSHIMQIGLIDYDMKTGGIVTIEAIRQIEEEEGRTRSMIALVTNHSEDLFRESREEAMDAGADIAIPFSSPDARAQINAFLKKAVVRFQ